jgi:hypothetical protein
MWLSMWLQVIPEADVHATQRCAKHKLQSCTAALQTLAFWHPSEQVVPCNFCPDRLGTCQGRHLHATTCPWAGPWSAFTTTNLQMLSLVSLHHHQPTNVSSAPTTCEHTSTQQVSPFIHTLTCRATPQRYTSNTRVAPKAVRTSATRLATPVTRRTTRSALLLRTNPARNNVTNPTVPHKCCLQARRNHHAAANDQRLPSHAFNAAACTACTRVHVTCP